MESTDLWSKGGPAGTDNATALGKEEMSPDLQRLLTPCQPAPTRRDTHVSGPWN